MFGQRGNGVGRKGPAPDMRGPAPQSIKELADYASRMAGDFDTGISIRVYLRAVHQLDALGRSYYREGDFDSAFVHYVKVVNLAKEKLPRYHPEWSTLSAAERSQLAKDADRMEDQLSYLKRVVQKREDDWKAGVSVALFVPPPAPARKSSPAPSVASTSTASTTTATPEKKGGNKLKKAWNKGKAKMDARTAAKKVHPAPAPIDEEEEDSGAGGGERDDWQLVESTASPHDGRNGGDTPTSTKSAPMAYPSGPPKMTVRPPARDDYEQMPMPGEGFEQDEEEESPNTIEYNRNYNLQHSYGMRPQPTPQWPQQPPPQQRQHASLPPSITYHALPPPSAPTSFSYPYMNASQPSRTASGPPPSRSAGAAIAYQQQPPLDWHQPGAPVAPIGNGAQLSRRASRLTTAHQLQQGFAPSRTNSAAPPPPSNQFTNGPPMPPSIPSFPPPPQPSYQPPPPALPPLQMPSQYPSAPPPFPPQASYPQPPAPPGQYGRVSPMPPTQPAFRPPPPPSQAPIVPQYPSSGSRLPSAPPADEEYMAPYVADSPGGGSLMRTSSLAVLPVGLRGQNWPDRRSPQSSNFGMHELKEVVEDEIEFGDTTEGGMPLRPIILPYNLVGEFVKLAADNTEKGIETCALLMGCLSRDTFTITDLLVPKQEGTPDTCTTTHEEEQFAYQDKHDLVTLGWIHTHPTQSCFMSSLDLHTHASYQVMLAEAIAIVCAPKFQPSFGVFRLTDPPGLETIVKCTEPGSFHPHPPLPIYTDCDHGHVRLRNNYSVKVADLRYR